MKLTYTNGRSILPAHVEIIRQNARLNIVRHERISCRYARRWKLKIVQRQAAKARKDPQDCPRAGAPGGLDMSKLMSTLLLSCTSKKVRR